MSTTTTTTRGQLDLPGQTHVADGPLDHTGMYVMHHAFRRDLAAFASAAHRTPVGETAVWEALVTRWGRFTSTLHHHHTAEDELYWPVLARAVAERGTPADAAEVRAMSEEHEGIDPLVSACADAFRAMAGHPCDAHRNALGIRLAGLRELLDEHLRHEETVVLPLVQRVMTEAEFDAVEKAIGRSYPAREIGFVVGWALHRLPQEGRDRMFAMAGPAYRVLHLVVRRRFERGEEAAFRYAEG
ncbi:hemerythrin domain-containing protein [Phycicoccus sp. KQZ13P-1]|uniref:hemerythrin domain-containing protein n=1 Tax=Phycicoccus mangrovi TaxID=2840470 RepID=UPI001C0087B8|nr:hemerythrin domain-containing protein [Phycicoccus mangrovi]MBT9255168.1 hemerythrin domain-containing protein [Phycicoccus mangrovi]